MCSPLSPWGDRQQVGGSGVLNAPKAPSAGADPFFGYLSAERLLHSGVNLLVRELLSLQIRPVLFLRFVVIRTYSSTALDGPMCLSISVRSSPAIDSSCPVSRLLTYRIWSRSFTCKVCCHSGADVRPLFEPTRMGTDGS